MTENGTGAFLVPRRPDGGERDRIWDYVRRWWERKVPEFAIVEGSSPDGPFSRAAALNDAYRRARPDFGIVLDADVVAYPDSVRAAVAVARRTGEVVLPFEEYHALSPGYSRAVLAGHASPDRRGRLTTRKTHESSIVVVPREAWERIGGFDERFVGWGQEDVAFAQAARVLVGLRRVPGEVFHLYHGRTKERIRSAPTYAPNQARGRRYREANDPDAIRALLAEP